MELITEHDLLSLVLAILGSRRGLTAVERTKLEGVKQLQDSDAVAEAVSRVRAGQDPLGEAFSVIRTADARRRNGQIFTPDTIVGSMIARAKLDAVATGDFAAVVDPGAGSGRFIRQAGKAFPAASLIAIEHDPVCAMILRANCKIMGLEHRCRIIVGDYRALRNVPATGRTLFIGNPPYVRHHDISECWKTWYADCTESLGARGSKLAGLHVHFFIKTYLLSTAGDLALFVTSAEWMETNYGRSLRHLLAGPLGGTAIHVVDAKSEPFPGVMTTAAITVFRPHISSDTIRFRKVDTSASLHDLTAGHDIPIQQLVNAPRWSAEQHILFPPRRVGGTRIGELFRVSRGQVTGCNAVWIAGEQAKELPEVLLVPCITSAKEIFDAAGAGGRLTASDHLERIVCLPQQLENEPPKIRKAIHQFLEWARAMGADISYVARHRTPWWSVALHQPAPIICTYMARKTPAFVRNDAGARILNIAHGLYPKVGLSPLELDEICIALNAAVRLADGRIYAGGLTKFEPKAVEALVIDWVRNREREALAL